MKDPYEPSHQLIRKTAQIELKERTKPAVGKSRKLLVK